MSCEEPDFLRGCSTRLGTRLCTAPLLAVAQSVPREGGMGAASTNWAPPRGRSGHGPLEPHDGKHKQAWAGFLRGGCHTSTKHSGPGGTKDREQWHSAGAPGSRCYGVLGCRATPVVLRPWCLGPCARGALGRHGPCLLPRAHQDPGSGHWGAQDRSWAAQLASGKAAGL